MSETLKADELISDVIFENLGDLVDVIENENIEIVFNDLDEDSDYDEDEDDYDEEQYNEDDYDWLEAAMAKSPWQFDVPEDLNETLHHEQYSHKPKMWRTLYPNVKDKEIDVAQAAADYYLLFGLVHNSFVEFEPLVLPSLDKLTKAGELLGHGLEAIQKRHLEIQEQAETDPRSKLTRISKKAEKLFHDHVEEIDTCFREYVHLACGGELRHHPEIGGVLGGTAYRRGAWARWYFIYKDNGPEALLQMADMFEEFGGGTYGGPPWANAARILHQRETGQLGPDDFTNKQLFIDRVFTLEHNGGCFLNKLDWVNKRTSRESPYSINFYEMKDYVLNAHASNPVNIDMLLGFASDEVQTLVREYLTLANNHEIEISGSWKDKKIKSEPKKKVTLEKTHSNSVIDESSLIDWSDMEGSVDVKIKSSNPLVQQLEQSIKEMEKNNKEFDTSFMDSGKVGTFAPAWPKHSEFAVGVVNELLEKQVKWTDNDKGF